MAGDVRYGLPTIRMKRPSAWELWFQTRWGRPPDAPEGVWKDLAAGRREAVADLYNWLAAYTTAFADSEMADRLAASVQTYGRPEVSQAAREAALFVPTTRPPDFGWQNWRWGMSDVRWGAFLEGLRAARQRMQGDTKEERPSFPSTAFNWLERLGEWGLKWKIDPVDVNNRFLRGRGEKARAARELASLFKAAPSQEVAQIGRAMVGSFSDLIASSPFEEQLGYSRPIGGRGASGAFRNMAWR